MQSLGVQGGRGRPPTRSLLATPTGTPTTHTPIATPIPRHDAATETARGSVAQVHNFP